MKHVFERWVAMTVVCVSVSGLTALGQDVESSLALGVKLGTLGASAEATIPVTPSINIRGVGNYLDFSSEETVNDVDYDLDFSFASFGGYLDWHPFQNNFRISAGALITDNEIDLESTPRGAVIIGNTTYPAALVGTLDGSLVFEEVAPYIGIGFGNASTGQGRWSFSFDLGVLLQSAEVDLTASGPVTQYPGFSEDLAAEEEDIQDDLDKFEIYPVLSFGIACRL